MTHSDGIRRMGAGFARREPLRVRWGRRAISVSVLFALTSLYVVAFPVLLPVAIVADLFRRHAWLTLRCGGFFGYYLLVETATVLAITGAWIVRGLRPGLPMERFVHWNWNVQKAWSYSLYWGASRIFGVHTEVDGADLVRRGPMIIFIRHVSLADTMLPLVLIGVPNHILLRYVLKSELLWDPPIDIAGHILPNVFIRRGTGHGDEVTLVRALAHGLAPTDGVLIYPEGTRFTPEKRDRILASLARKDPDAHREAKALRNLLPVHPGGPLALLEGNENADVIFCAHVGLEGTTHLRDFLHGALLGSTVRVRFWRVPFAEIPTSPAERTAWLYAWWQRVDAWIGENGPPAASAGAAD